MKKITFSLLLFLFFSMAVTSAQSNEAPNALTYRWMWSNFQYPVTDNHDWNDYTSGVELSYVRHLSDYLNLAIPLKLGKASLPLDDTGADRDESLIISLDALMHLKPFKGNRTFYPYLLAGAGLMTEVDNDWAINPEIPVGLGLNLRLAPQLYLSAEGQYRFDFSDNRNHLQPVAGLWIGLGGSAEPEKVTVLDADKDGIPDAEDQCPNQPGTAAMFGCPDTDGDGVADKYDNCITEAGKAELKGCPDRDNDNIPDMEDLCPDEPGTVALKGCPNKDRDGDGITDGEDKCPDAAGPVLTKGCPDGDKDGVADSEDKCPTVAGLPNFMGCPDTDKDGIADPEDKCPNSAGPASNSGCPEIRQEDKKVLEFAMKAVQFETGSARLLPESNKVLDEIAGIMKNYPDHKLRISGHTDSIGDAAANQSLSEKRAKACYDYLVSKGISATRMSHQGFGETKPIGDNRYAPGREQNRRVEFDLNID